MNIDMSFLTSSVSSIGDKIVTHLTQSPFHKGISLWNRLKIVIPAKAGIHNNLEEWIPTFVGMTVFQGEIVDEKLNISLLLNKIFPF